MILLRDTDTETDSGPGSPMVRSFLAHQSEHHGQDSSVSAWTPGTEQLSTSQHEDILALPGPRPPDEQCMDELLWQASGKVIEEKIHLFSKQKQELKALLDPEFSNIIAILELFRW